MVKVAFIGTKNFPIPDIRGGAIETLVTGIIDENEKRHLMDLSVFTIDSDGLDNYIKKYRYTKFIKITSPTVWVRMEVFAWRILRRLSNYKVPYKNNFMVAVNKILSQNHFDIIMYENEATDMMQAKRYKGTKNVMHIHADYITAEMEGIKWLCQYCDCVVGVSEFITNRMEQISYMKGKGKTLKNAIDLSGFSGHINKEEIRALRETLGLEADDFVVLYCGRLSKEKGCLELIKAVEQVPNIKLVVVGGENFSSNKRTEYVDALHKEAENIKGRVVFTGHVNHLEVGRYYAAVNIGVVPSICNEAASLTILEYRAAGLPTIASKMGGIPEYCNGNTTLLVDYNENFVKNLAIAIQKLVDDENLRVALSGNSRNGLKEYGYDVYYDNFAQLMKDIHYDGEGKN